MVGLYLKLKFNFLGKYYYYEASSPVTIGQKANLVAANLGNPNQQADACLEFYYHMYGSDMGTLAVQLQLNTGSRVVWQMTGKYFLNDCIYCPAVIDYVYCIGTLQKY